MTIGSVLESGPAAKAGAQAGDKIVKLGDSAIQNPNDLSQALRALRPGATVKVTVLREQKEVVLDVTLGGPTG